MAQIHNYDLIFNIFNLNHCRLKVDVDIYIYIYIYILLLVFCTCGTKNLTDVQQLI